MLYAFYKAVDNKAWDDIPGNNIMLATLAPEIGSTWITETIAPYSFAGDFSRLVMDADDHPHLTSQDFSSEDIRYTYWDGTAWHDELVALDSRGNLNSYAISSLALDAAGDPHIAYINEFNEWMAYGYRDEGGWHFEHIPGVFGTSFALGLGPGEKPLIAFGDRPLGFAYKEGSTWYSEVLTTTTAEELSMQVDIDGRPHLSFNGGGALWYAYQDAGESWNFEKVNTPQAVGTAYGLISLVLDASGYPHIAHVAYPGDGNYNVVYSHKDLGVWQSTVVEAETGGYPELAIDSDGFPHVVYLGKEYGDYPEFKRKLRYAYEDEEGWHYQTLDVLMMVMKGSPQIELDSLDRPYISYADYNYLLVLSKTAPPDVEDPTLPNEPGSDSPLITPAPGAILDTPRPFFDWTDGHDDVEVISYTLVITGPGAQVLLSSQATVYQVNTSESLYAPDFDLPGGSYRWTVRAIDLTGNVSAWAEPQQFTVGAVRRVFLAMVVRNQ